MVLAAADGRRYIIIVAIHYTVLVLPITQTGTWWGVLFRRPGIFTNSSDTDVVTFVTIMPSTAAVLKSANMGLLTNSSVCCCHPSLHLWQLNTMQSHHCSVTYSSDNWDRKFWSRTTGCLNANYPYITASQHKYTYIASTLLFTQNYETDTTVWGYPKQKQTFWYSIISKPAITNILHWGKIWSSSTLSRFLSVFLLELTACNWQTTLGENDQKLQ